MTVNRPTAEDPAISDPERFEGERMEAIESCALNFGPEVEQALLVACGFESN